MYVRRMGRSLAVRPRPTTCGTNTNLLQHLLVSALQEMVQLVDGTKW